MSDDYNPLVFFVSFVGSEVRGRSRREMGPAPPETPGAEGLRDRVQRSRSPEARSGDERARDDGDEFGRDRHQGSHPEHDAFSRSQQFNSKGRQMN